MRKTFGLFMKIYGISYDQSRSKLICRILILQDLRFAHPWTEEVRRCDLQIRIGPVVAKAEIP